MKRVAITALMLFTLAGCMAVGREFPTASVEEIVIGETTRAQVLEMFGEPWRTGLEDGRRTWTFAHYRYALFGSAKTRDLVVRFDEVGKVASYTFNSSYAEDVR